MRSRQPTFGLIAEFLLECFVYSLPRKEFHRYQQRIDEAGFGKRVMFGSDQMNWPATIEVAIESIF